MKNRVASAVLVAVLVFSALSALNALQAHAAGLPAIGSVSPGASPADPAWAGRVITVNGADFGTYDNGVHCLVDGLGVGKVTFRTLLTGVGWTNTKIQFVMPGGEPQGYAFPYTSLNVVNRDGHTGGNLVRFYTAPHITSLNPSTVGTGGQVTVNGKSLTGVNWPEANLSVWVNGVQVPDTSMVSRNDSAITFTVTALMKSGPVQVRTMYGNSNTDKTLTINYAPVATGQSRYFAEGCTGYGFDTWIEALVGGTLINGKDDPVQTSFMTETGPVKGPSISVPTVGAARKVTLHLNGLVPGHNVSTEFSRDTGVEFCAQRMMYWGNAVEGTMAPAARSAEKTWYLAEGSTAWGFETWILIQNPFKTAAHVAITYMTASGPVAATPRTVAPESRMTIGVNNELPGWDFSTKITSDTPVLVERAMYWNNRRGGTDSYGACDESQGVPELSKPSQDIYLAEGTTSWGFDEWVLVQNPNTEPVTVSMTYMTPGGPVGKAPFLMQPQTRCSVHVNNDVHNDVSVQVHGDRPILAERAMYWNNGTGKAGHASVGVAQGMSMWGFGAGHTESPYETWVLVQNPTAKKAHVRVDIYDATGYIGETKADLNPQTRCTFNMANYAPGKSISTEVFADNDAGNAVNVISEESIYWNNRTGGDCSLGASVAGGNGPLSMPLK